jgi:hypothetical protein
MSSNYESVKAWRKRHKKYNSEFMRERRAHFRRLFLSKKIAYADIPKSYRYF